MLLKTAVPRRRESRIVGALGEACPLQCVRLQDSSISPVWKDIAGRWSIQSHNTGFVGLFTLSCGVYAAIRISTIHLDNRHLHISAGAFRVCQESCTGGGLLVSSNTAHKSISTPLQIFSTLLMAYELLTNLLGQENAFIYFLSSLPRKWEEL